MLFVSGILGLIFMVVGFFVFADGDSHHNMWETLLGAGLGIFAAVVFALSLTYGLKHEHHYEHKQHMEALRQLTDDGWDIQSHDVHWQDNKVDINCFRFKMKKINDHYRVVIKRNEDIGGGYTFLTPKDQPTLIAICTNQQTDNYYARKEAIRGSVRG